MPIYRNTTRISSSVDDPVYVTGIAFSGSGGGGGDVNITASITIPTTVTNAAADLVNSAPASPSDTAVVVTMHPFTAGIPVTSSAANPIWITGSVFGSGGGGGGGDVNITGSSVTISTLVTNASADLVAGAPAVNGDTAVIVTMHPMTAVPSYSSGTSIATVAASTGSVTLKAANSSRRFASVANDSTSPLFIALSSSASSSSYTIKLKTDDYYEIPSGYTGIVTGVWVSATGSARVTELT